MVRKSLNTIAAGLVAIAVLGVPAVGSAQDYRYRDDYRSRESARCERPRHVYDDGYRRESYPRRVYYETYRPEPRYYREHRRSKAKSALVIGGSAATGAGIGAAIRGGKGALIGAAIGGGVASIYEAGKRR